ncbi:nicotinamide mononucleotide transporter [Mycoplasma sp. CSL10137]|uniref:nicotinamide mononucleotide transporter n=1 Tax=unclassified Mycoplasma TaxID=2683645 RepID=UPI00197BB120|nr:MULTISPECIES: nicotinamide mononucleotide transporter [unclassified Mycoplasma]MBN4083275.1 nicotinamide mononucleotide transporter [Mycoplasma sp. CSL10137]MBN4084420.1 nicotinamide mononucleotide transporter [Mycoplasma sp. CSL10166]
MDSIKTTKLDKILLISLTLIITIFSAFSIENKTIIWDSNVSVIVKILGIIVASSAIFGVIATWWFYTRKKYAFLFAILNAFLFGIYSISLNLVADFIIYVGLCVPTFIYLRYITKYKNRIKQYRFNWLTSIFIVSIWVISFIVLYFTIPHLTFLYGKMIKQSLYFENNFNNKFLGKIIAISIDSTLLVAVVMMILGMKSSWVIWQIKNILSIIFFAGIGILNWSVIIINISFSVLSLYIFIKTFINKKRIIAITGPGCSGKSTLLNNPKIQKLLKDYNILLKDERSYLDNANINNNDYIKALSNKGSYFDAEKMFFESQKKIIIESNLTNSHQLLDRHMSDSFLHADVLIKENKFTKSEKEKWIKEKRRYKWFLMNKPKLDLLIVVKAPWENIRIWRKLAIRDKDKTRRKLEFDNLELFKKFREEYEVNEEWLKIAKLSSKKIIFLNNNIDGDKGKEKLVDEFYIILKQYLKI